ncbi:hypothetical protein J437_LFUL005007 [Ladona fulva]|uniref:Uncharacterized protein n=1 Tax=Ladona fulva TaxID=123851 RepID=A0A8K0NUV9_LADFU|nr:hypothetical protein J437_LFUL005007 [Ladona fulva]
MRKKNAPVSLATALAISVFPVPGGPYIRIPLGGLTPMALKRLGCRRGCQGNYSKQGGNLIAELSKQP